MQQFVSVGNKVDMEILIHGHLEEDDEKRRVLSCKVMDLPDQNIVRITMPFYEGRLVPLSVGDQYMMNIYGKKGIVGSKFVVVSRMKEGNIFLADMELQQPLKKIQRREYFRHNCRISANYHMLSPEEALSFSTADLLRIPWKQGIFLNIGGGGVKMISDCIEEEGKPILLQFPITYEGAIVTMVIYGRIIESRQNSNNNLVYDHRIEFEHIEDKEREKIIHYIFDEERKKISKERGM